MNKKGFTLIELLAVIVIIGIIGLVAVPNMLGISVNTKKEQMLDDARKLISVAKMKINTDYDARNSSTPTRYYFNDLNVKGDIKSDPDGGMYTNNSYVEYRKGETTASYCVYLEGTKRVIGTSASCVMEANLYSKSNVVSKET